MFPFASMPLHNAMPTRIASLPFLASALVCLAVAPGACKKAEVATSDAASADRYVPPDTGGSGGGGGQASGGSGGGQSGQNGGGGALQGDGGGSGSGGASSKGGNSGRDAASGGATGKDAEAASDDGGVSCSDITSTGRLGVYYYSDSAATGTSSIMMHMDVVNFTALSARLSQVTLRYWFTDEAATSANVLEQYYVPVATTMKFVAVNPPRPGASTMLEISYPVDPDAGTSFVETRGFNFAFHKNNYAGNYDQTNDYSYDATLKTTLGLNPKITAYINGVLSWGCEPPLQ
jgi:hypothetical protein